MKSAGQPVPWWCTSTEEIPVTDGPAVGTVDYYAGTHKAPLSWDDCKTMSAQFDLAKDYADAVADRGRGRGRRLAEATAYVPGMGTHHIRGGITPAMLADPSFNRQTRSSTPPASTTCSTPTKPEVLQFDGNGPTAKLVGFDYYVRTATGRPPAGFAGQQRLVAPPPVICFRTTDAAMIGFNTSDANCTSLGRHQRQHVELLHAPRLGARRHEVHPRRVRRA